MGVRAIVTGTTGMVGEGVLHECLLSNEVEAVLVINRRPCNISHPKLKEIIHFDFYHFEGLKEELRGYNACFFCLGVSSVGMKEADYKSVTYDLTMALAKVLAEVNPGMTFCYVSGAGTDSTEKGRSMWARVKGKTENDLIRLFSPNAYMFRPGYMQPTPGLKNAYKVLKVIAPLYPIWKALFPRFVSSLREVGLAMINTATMGYEKPIMEVPDINLLAAMTGGHRD